jgi:hypothetical protein
MFRTAAASLTGRTVGPNNVVPTTEFAPFHNLDAVNAWKTVTPAPQLDRW